MAGTHGRWATLPERAMENYWSRTELLLKSLSIDKTSFADFLEWALSEQLVARICEEKELLEKIKPLPDKLKRFRDFLNKLTNRNWSEHDFKLIYDIVRTHSTKHFREPIPYEEYLRWVAHLSGGFQSRWIPDCSGMTNFGSLLASKLQEFRPA